MLTSLFLSIALTSSALSPLQPTPSARQLEWQKMETYAFCHFGPNTFTDKEWGQGTEDPNLFNPTKLDCRQWARTLKAGGMKGIIITAKHHDGFCLWPSKFSTHTVAQCKWRDGKGDVLKDLSTACHEEGLKFGIYISPWDRNHPAYGTPEYNQVFNHMLEEVLTKYGPIFEVWFDGANGEGPNGKKQVYDWKLFHSTVRRLQPQAVIFSDAGPDIRWVGNESGLANETNWATLNKDHFRPGTPRYAELTEGNAQGRDWLPNECDVSIRPGWFYHPSEDAKVKTPAELEKLYYASVGRNSHLLLNVPPNREGLISPEDAASLAAFHHKISATFGHDLAANATVTATSTRGEEFAPDNVVNHSNRCWAAEEGAAAPTVTVLLDKPALLDRVVLAEPIELGQRVKGFTVDAMVDGSWRQIARGTTIGAKRILAVEPIQADAIRVNIEDSKAAPALSTIALFASPDATAKAQIDPLMETPEQKAKRMEWFELARFGMFIHWGLYSVPAGSWNGKDYDGAAEWLQYNAKIKPADYEPLQQQFNPVKFDADKWVRIAKSAGMKYIVITSKHHEGFGMWPSAQGTWNIGHTQFHRDPLKELAAACKKGGIKLCFYHSIMDWHHPDYLPRRPWDDRPTTDASLDRYVDYMKAQLKELLTNYGPIGILWFDGEWEDTWTHERGIDLYKYIRTLQPNIIVNNRVDTGRSGIQGFANGGNVGDYGTPEQTIPPNGLPGQYWETCMTMNDTWGFHASDHNWKSASTLIRNLIDIASKGGNYLLNVGPTSLGEIPDASIERLAAVGKWTHANGEALYGTTASPFPRPLKWGRVTQRPGKLYCSVFDPGDGTFLLTGLKTPVTRAYLLADKSKKPLRFEMTESGPKVTLPLQMPDPIASVVVVEIESTPVVDMPVVVPAADGGLTLLAEDATIHGDAVQYESANKAIGYWTNASDSVGWNFKLDKPAEFNVQLELACEPTAAGSTFEVSVGDQILSGTVPDTGGWQKFVKLDLGKIAVVSPGTKELVVKPKAMKSALMNLRSVKLTRAN